jgi:RNA polymerase sigma-70 factor (ECF subfamily)
LDIERLRGRDAAEFTRFVRRYEGFVMGLCQSLGLGAADRDDAAAETFAIAYCGLATFRGQSELSTWLYRIAYRTALKVRRRYRGPVGGHPPAAELDANLPDAGGPLPGTAAEARELSAGVWAAVARLDPEQAAAVELFYRRGMRVEDVAAVMEKPTGTVKTLLFRARERLRVALKPLEHRV